MFSPSERIRVCFQRNVIIFQMSKAFYVVSAFMNMSDNGQFIYFSLAMIMIATLLESYPKCLRQFYKKKILKRNMIRIEK